MNVEFTLKNYRCFSDTSPARFCVRDGIIAFVGVNNAGKSSLLKFFYEFRPLFNYLSNLNEFTSALAQNGNTLSYGSTIKDWREVFCNQNNRDLEIEIRLVDIENHDGTSNVVIPHRWLIKVHRADQKWSLTLFLMDPSGRETNTEENIPIVNGAELKMNGVDKIDLSSCFEVFQSLAQMLYIGPFRNAINVGASQFQNPVNYYDIAIGEAFIRNWQRHKTGQLITDNEIIIRVTDDIKRIFGFDSLDISASEENKDFKIFINRNSYTLIELGGGLAQFIITLATVALRHPPFVLIDEPELNLHPQLQLDFLTALGSYAQHGVLFATHNIGLARASAELIYSVRVDGNGVHEITPLEKMPRLSEFLGELSFSGYREIGFTKLLLVEGTHDVTTYQQLLRKFQKDHEIVLMPLGGGSLINATSEIALQEIKRITQDVYAIIDSERDRLNAPLSKGIQEFVSLCKKVGIVCHVLERRAIENYFTDRAIKVVKSSKYSALKPYEHLNDAQNIWGKAENWRIAREMKRNELDNTDLGRFLSSL